jgi:hypothetical protein
VTLQTQAQDREVRALMRKAGVVPATATVTPGSPVIRAIAGPPADPSVPMPRSAVAAVAGTSVASRAQGSGAAALSAGFRRGQSGRGRRR